MGSDEEAQVLRLRVAPEVGEVGQALVGGHPDQENPKDGFKEEGVGVVGYEDPIGANVILDIVQGEDQDAFKEEEEQDGDENSGKFHEGEDVASVVPNPI